MIAISLIIIADIKSDNFAAVLEEKEILDQSFQTAVDDAALHLVEVEGVNGLTINKERAVDDFFYSMFASLNIIDNPEKQDLLRNYVPVIAVTTDDGYYFYYSDEYKGNNNSSYVKKRWSEKFPYYYEDDDFIYGFTLTDIVTLYDKNGLLDETKEQTIFTLDFHDLLSSHEYESFRTKRPDSFLLKEDSFYLIRKGSIITSIEESMSYYCNRHNLIAEQFGITYNFAMPIVDNSEWSRSIDNPGMIVMFQGYPFGSGIDATYNRFAIAGSRITKDHVYYMEQKDWYFVYHKDTCPELEKDGIILLTKPYYTVLDCVEQGSYGCETCIKNGVYAPDYANYSK
jgi:hypothetical protein